MSDLDTMTRISPPKKAVTSNSRVIRDPEFARRLESACDEHPHAPDKYRGRLGWLQDAMRKAGYAISKETSRKWFAGEARPRPDKVIKLAQILQVDPGWLSMGIDPEFAPHERKARNAMADGAVNVVAGFIQMDGGYPAFPEDGVGSKVDLFAIIKGANYGFHVSLGVREGKSLRFVVPTDHKDVVVLGVVREPGHCVKIYELKGELIDAGDNRGGSIEVVATIGAAGLKKIDHFRDRL